MAIFEFYGDHSDMDPMTRDILLGEFEEELIDEGFTPEEAKFHRKMMEEELFY